MARIEKSIEIEVPVEKAFAFTLDYYNRVRTAPLDMEMETLSQDEGPARVGSTWKVRAKVGENVFELDNECTELVKDKKFSERQKGGSLKKFEITHLFEPTEEGTKLTVIQEYELPDSLLGKIMDKLKVHKDIEKIMGHTLKKTKELLEKE